MSKAFDGGIIDSMTLPTLTPAGGQTYYFAFRAHTIFVQEYHSIPLRTAGIQLIVYAYDHTSLTIRVSEAFDVVNNNGLKDSMLYINVP